jgi:tetratricopeptide (TPR) repeat protein
MTPFCPGRRRRPPVSIRTACLVLIVALAAPMSLPARASAQSTEADVYVAQAVLDFSDRKYDEALANLTKALETEPDHVEALYFMGVVLMAKDQPAQATPFLEKARARSPDDAAIAFQLGLAYFAEQQYDRAQPLLEEVFRSQPTLDGLGYYVGFLRYRKKDYRGALDAFNAGRTSSPDLQQLTRFYSGLALGHLGLPGQAVAEIDQAIRLAPASAFTGPAERLRDSMVAARQGQRRLSAEVRLGFFYDDNVAVIPGTDGSEPLVAALKRDAASTGELFGLRADYAWLRTDQWEATIGYSFFTTYNNDLPAFNLMSHLANVGATYRTAVDNMPLLIGGQYAFDALFLDQEWFVLRHTVSAFASLVASDRYLTQLFARYQSKNFDQPLIDVGVLPAEDRDGSNWMIGGTQLFRFSEDRHYVKLGYQFDWDDTEGRNYEYLGNRIVAGGQYTLPWHAIRLRYDLDVHLRTYQHANTLFPTTAPGTRQRRDQEITNIVRAELPLPYSFTMALEYQSTINISNLPVFDYTRNVYTLMLSWSY